MKVLYRGALVLWLVSGFAIQAYFSRAAQGTVEVEQKRDLHLRQFENNDEVAREIRATRWDSQATLTAAYAAWALVGFVLALRGVRLLFRRADRVADVEKFLAASLVVLLLPGCMRKPFEPVRLETIGPNEEGFPQAQGPQNKPVLLEADGKARAILAEKKAEAEAEGIQAVADARANEISKAREDLATYLKLKQLELEGKRTEKWDGGFPTYVMGMAGTTPDLLLQMPAGAIETAVK